MKVLKNALILSLTCFSMAAGANEAPAEGAAKDDKSKALPEWVEIQARIQTLKAKVSAKEKTVRDLIIEKQKEKNPTKSVEIFKSLKTEHHDLEQVVKEYEQARNLLRYRYPEKGMKEGRQYQRMEVKPLEEMETQVGLEGKLRQTLGKVRRQYSETAPLSEAETQAAEAAAAVAEKEKRTLESAPSVTEPSVISK